MDPRRAWQRAKTQVWAGRGIYSFNWAFCESCKLCLICSEPPHLRCFAAALYGWKYAAKMVKPQKPPSKKCSLFPVDLFIDLLSSLSFD